MTLQAENKDTVEHIFYINDGIIMVFPKSNKVQSAEFTYQDHVTDPIPHNHDYAVCRLAAGEKEPTRLHLRQSLHLQTIIRFTLIGSAFLKECLKIQ